MTAEVDPIVVVGSGMAAYTLAREIRKLDKAVPLLIVTRDDGAFYSKPMLSTAISGGRSAAQLVMHSASAMAAQLTSTVSVSTGVDAIDPARCILRIGEREVRYRKLVLAVGADPVQPRIPGLLPEDLLQLNDLTDFERLRQALLSRKRVAILGAGLIGCEIADDLSRAGFEVTVFDLAPLPLSRLLPPLVSEALRDAMARSGVHWQLGNAVQRIDRVGDGFQIQAAQGLPVSVDVVLGAIGLRPRIAMAHDAGLRTASGIVVDRLMQTSDPHIHAIGDCAELQGRILPYVMPIMKSARALAQTLTGNPTPVVYPAMPIIVKTASLPLAIAPPQCEHAGGWTFEAGPERLKALYGDPQAPIGFVLAGQAVGERSRLERGLPAWIADEVVFEVG
ncbi:MAG: FAD-dependent oxidoreductase [Burkholderiaceae bacterium]